MLLGLSYHKGNFPLLLCCHNSNIGFIRTYSPWSNRKLGKLWLGHMLKYFLVLLLSMYCLFLDKIFKITSSIHPNLRVVFVVVVFITDVVWKLF